jgi:hypothetical protein
MKARKLLWMLGLAVAFLVVPGLEAGTIYTYTGNDFTVAFAPYTRSDFVTVSVTLSSPLPYNSGLTEYTPTAFSFSDGVDTLTNSTPDIDSDGFYFATANGVITTWYGYIWMNPGEEPEITTCGGVISCDPNTLDQGETLTSFAYVENDPGVWSGATQGAPAPEPSPVIMTSTGVLLLAGTMRYQRKRRAMRVSESTR